VTGSCKTCTKGAPKFAAFTKYYYDHHLRRMEPVDHAAGMEQIRKAYTVLFACLKG
jgi:hypothetical protein